MFEKLSLVYDLGYFISYDEKRENLLKKYYTSLDYVHHLNNFKESGFTKEFTTLLCVYKDIIAGYASDEFKKKATTYMLQI